MSIRLPLKVVGSFSEASEVGAGSVAGGIPHLFTLPQDTDNVVVKLTASVAGAGVSAVFQTTDDGGTTWFDVARTSVISNGALPEWLNISTQTPGFRSTVQAQSSVSGSTNVAVALNTIGNAAASTLSQSQMSGMPLLSQTARVFVIITGNITSAASNSILTEVKVNSQSATA